MSINYPTAEDIIRENSCYFCRETDKVFYKFCSSFDGYKYFCPHCGHYQITREAIVNLHRGVQFRTLGAAIAQERKLAELDGYILKWHDISGNDDAHQVCVNGIPFLASYPDDYLEKLDRTLINLGRGTSNSPLVPFKPEYQDYGLFFVEPPEEYYVGERPSDEVIGTVKERIQKTLGILEGLGWIRFQFQNIKGHWPPTVLLTVDGLKHLRELHTKLENKRQAFVAMWFTGKEQYADALKKYVEGISMALTETGYSAPCIANLQKYNGPIMNRVINDIKESRFLIADLTCDKEDGMRGGVYYEAGLAAGCGMPVILTCEREAHRLGLVHFDLKQFNTIIWYIDEDGVIRADGHPDEDFSQYVADWIIRTIGKA